MVTLVFKLAPSRAVEDSDIWANSQKLILNCFWRVFSLTNNPVLTNIPGIEL